MGSRKNRKSDPLFIMDEALEMTPELAQVLDEQLPEDAVIVLPMPLGDSPFKEHEELHDRTMREIYNTLRIPSAFLAGKFGDGKNR